MGKPSHVTEEFIEKNLCKGIHGSRFFDSEKIKIGNRFVLALLYSFDSKLIDLAEYCNVNIKQVERWCYGKTVPNYVNMKKITHYFNVEEDILFGDYAYRFPYGVKAIRKAQGDNIKFRSNKSANIKKPLLYGLMWLYKLKTQAVADYCKMDVKILREILYTDKKPSNGSMVSLSRLFHVPPEILFMEGFRTRTAERRASNE